MTLPRLIILAALVGAMTIVLVHEQARITQAGYRISQLSHDEVKLGEEVRVHKVYVTRLRQPEFIRRQIVRLGLEEGRRDLPVEPEPTGLADASGNRRR